MSCSWHRRPHGLFVLLAAWPSCSYVSAHRHAAKSEAPALGHMDGDLEKMMAMGMEVAEDGGYRMPDGSRLIPFDGQSPESVLSTEDFVCHEGQLFGLHLPPAAKEEAGEEEEAKVFHYLKLRHDVPHYHPVAYYLDLFDEKKHFLLFPPVDKHSEEYRVVHRIEGYDAAGAPAWSEQRVFAVPGTDHPCGAKYNVEIEDDSSDEGTEGAGDAAE